MQKNQFVEFHDEDTVLKLEIAHSNGYISARRTLLQGSALKINRDNAVLAKKDGVEDEEDSIKFARLVMFPDLIAPVVSQEGFAKWPPTLEQFLSLDELFLRDWTLAVYALNPHWEAQDTTKEEQEKKEIKPNSASETTLVLKATEM